LVNAERPIGPAFAAPDVTPLARALQNMVAHFQLRGRPAQGARERVITEFTIEPTTDQTVSPCEEASARDAERKVKP
jgi:hypothetical protein